MSQPRERSAARTAFSLVEAVISIALVSIVLIAALSTLGATARTRGVQTAHQQRDVLARQLMSEILRGAFTDPDVDGSAGGLELGEPVDDRTGWDDVDDYHGLSNEPPQEPDGTAMVQFTNWTRSVGVHNVSTSDPSEIGTPIPETGLKHIAVTITDPWGGQTTLTSMKSRDGINDAMPTSSLSYTSWVGIELQVGDDASARLSSGAALLNHPPAVTINLLNNPGFEDGTTNWSTVGSATIAPHTELPHNGVASLAVEDRSNASAGPIQNVTAHLESGRTYRFRTWAQPHNTTECQLIPTIILQTSAGTTSVDGAPVWASGGWTEISFDFTPVFAGVLQEGYVGVRSSASEPVTDFLLDDAWLYEVSP